MKKILLILCLLPMCIGKVFASEVYYSDYSEFSNWQEENVIPSDTTYVEEEKRYLWYQKENILGDYALYESSGNFSNDCYITDLTEWTTERPPTHESRTISSRYQYTYQLSKSARYIHLKNVQGSDAFHISELRTIIGSNDFLYQYTCEGCSDNFGSYIRDGNTVESTYIQNGGELIIDLLEYYPIHLIKLQLNLSDTSSHPKTYTVGFSQDKKNPFVSQNISLQFISTESNPTEYIEHTIWNLNVADSDWSTFEVTYDPYYDRKQASIQVVEEFAYTEKMCRIQNEKRTYTDDYYIHQPEGYSFKDEEQFKIYYHFKNRDKLELVDDFIIRDKTFNINEFIIESTKPYIIDGDINKNINGTYPITIRSGNIKVQKDVSVQIWENEMMKYEREIENIRNQLSQLQQSWNQEKEEYENHIVSLENQIISLKQQLLLCQEKCAEDKLCLQTLLDQKNQLLKEYEEKLLNFSNQINQYQIELQKKELEIEELKKQKHIDTEKIVVLQKQVDQLINESKTFNEDIENNYQMQLEGKDRLLTAYIYQIQQLTKQLSNVHQNVKEVIEQRDYYKQEAERLQAQLENFDNQNPQCDSLSQELEVSKKEKDDLNQKLNNYMLKIRGENRLSLLWFYILCLLLFMGTIIYKWRKKSNVK